MDLSEGGEERNPGELTSVLVKPISCRVLKGGGDREFNAHIKEVRERERERERDR